MNHIFSTVQYGLTINVFFLLQSRIVNIGRDTQLDYFQSPEQNMEMALILNVSYYFKLGWQPLEKFKSPPPTFVSSLSQHFIIPHSDLTPSSSSFQPDWR